MKPIRKGGVGRLFGKGPGGTSEDPTVVPSGKTDEKINPAHESLASSEGTATTLSPSISDTREFPKEQQSSHDGNKVPEKGTDIGFPMGEQSSQNGNIVAETGTSLFKWQFTARQQSILNLILALQGDKGYAIIPRQSDFTVCGVSKTKIRAELEELEELQVLDWDRIGRRYWVRFDRQENWKVKVASGFSDELLRALLAVNDVPETETKFPNEQQSSQNGNKVSEEGTTSDTDKFPEREPPSQNGNFPKEEPSSQNGNQIPETVTVVEFPKGEQGSQTGNKVDDKGTENAFSGSTASTMSGDKDQEKKEFKIHDHDDEVNSLRQSFRQYKSLWHAYEDMFGVSCNQILLEELHSFVDDGMSAEVVMYYMRYARANAKPIQYAKRCIVNAFEQGCMTLDAILEAQREFEARRGGGGADAERAAALKELEAAAAESSVVPHETVDDEEIKRLLAEMKTSGGEI